MTDIGQRLKIHITYRQHGTCEDVRRQEFCICKDEWKSMSEVEKRVHIEEEIINDLEYDYLEEDVERGS